MEGTGQLSRLERYGVRPSVALLATVPGDGMPLGEILGIDVVVGVFTEGAHGSTFGGILSLARRDV